MTVSGSQPQQPIESVHPCSRRTSNLGSRSTNTTTTTAQQPATGAGLDAAASSMALCSGNMSSSSSSSTSCSPTPHASAAASPGHPQQQQHSGGTPTSALRRLYFKTARVSKAASKAATAATVVAAAASTITTVPKVIVMGSSTTSEATTINTSTDSASTHVTNVTTTTDTETNDSLDLGDTSGQSEPLLSSLDDESSSIVMMNETNGEEDENITVINGPPDTPMLISYQELEDMSPASPMFSPRDSPKPGSAVAGLQRTAAHHNPRTAPATSGTTRFPFDPPVSPPKAPSTARSGSRGTPAGGGTLARTHETMFSFDESPNPIRRPPPKLPPSSVDQTPEHSPNAAIDCLVATQRQPPPADPAAVISSSSTPKRLMNSFKTRKERFVQQAGSAVAAATAAVTSGPGKPFKNPNYDPDLTMFPFDREAIDYERIQRECFAVEEELLFEDHCTGRSRPDRDDDRDELQRILDGGVGCESPSKLLFDSEIFSDHYSIFQQYAYLSQQERSGAIGDRSHGQRKVNPAADAFSPQRRPETAPACTSTVKGAPSRFDQIATKFDMMPPSKLGGSVAAHHQLGCGTLLPDLRVDYFAETSITISPSSSPSSSAGIAVGEPSAPPPGTTVVVARAPSPRLPSAVDAVVVVTGTGAHAAGAINVTPNPMDGAVCTQPRATIVVQQPSLSLDYTSVETILLKNEGDFISVEQGKEGQQPVAQKKKQQREEHMRQLLDVTNTLTTEEIKDFEMRYGSPHHSRSQSVKTPGSRAGGRPNQLCLPQQRSRVASMPNTGVEEEYYRLRHFSITGKGVVNRGDSLKSRRSKSNNSVASSNSSTEHLTPAAVNVAGSARTSATCSLASSRESSTSNPGSGPYKVLMLGGAAVGKSSLVSQFMTSEYLHAYDTSIDDDSGEKTVSVLLSGEESELTFIDHSYTEMAPENCMATYDPHGYCVIYSSADKGSFLVAERVLQILWTTENIAQKAVILVANKADLARSRMVASDEGKAMATQYDCKFIETSVGINHNVDELLVGLLSQIRLKLENPEKSRDLFRKRSIRKSKRRACSPLGGAICLAGIGGNTNPSTPVSGPPAPGGFVETPPGSAHSSPRKYRGSRTSASLKVKGLLGRVWARDSKSKSCENLHVL
ncbi:uncharacterized protein LOC131206095 [Anopheles bellator]|uniref:uncharacterized protein LOC131206095 n=1 Tax=Anopheles bellator TaxID=139047 RepID=UPI002647BEE4|nr:uncharacterized protein LOC131206095 [Anopheles bellator]